MHVIDSETEFTTGPGQATTHHDVPAVVLDFKHIFLESWPLYRAELIEKVDNYRGKGWF
jgi:hypothetical protein